jgi:Domain of unknown function (DUF1704).
VDYLYLLSHNCQDESRPLEERQQWANAFTEQSIAIYGKPDIDVARIIEAGGGDSFIKNYQPMLDIVNGWLTSRYSYALDALKLNDKTEKLTPLEISQAFTDGLNALKANDPRLSDWEVVITEGATLSCDAGLKQIKIGENRAAANPKKIKGLFAHEVLRHCLTAVNGEDLGVVSALPRYISAEEGFAKIYETSFSEESQQAAMDTYADISWSIGDLDGEKHTRSQLIQRVLDRKRARGEKVTTKSERIAYNKANRLFRGTPGTDEVSGVFTKDISYFAGFVPCIEFIKQGLDSGKDINEIMSFANAAKFDPNDPAQSKYIQSKIMDRYLPKLPLALPDKNSQE